MYRRRENPYLYRERMHVHLRIIKMSPSRRDDDRIKDIRVMFTMNGKIDDLQQQKGKKRKKT